jgi:hypothetical protein
MTQDLFYTQVSSSLTLVKSNGEVYSWNYISRLEVSGSAYDATVSGSDFGGTVASARIYAYSGSTLIVTFPLESTNLFFQQPPPILPANSPETSSLSLLNWNFNTIYSPDPSGSGASIYDSSSAFNYINLHGYDGESLGGSFLLTSGNNYIFSVTGSGTSEIGLYINNDTSGSVVFTQTASSGYISTSYSLLAFNDYSVTFSIIGSAP